MIKRLTEKEKKKDEVRENAYKCAWERAREGLCERENNEIDENNVRDEKWTKEWKKTELRKKSCSL